MPETRVPLFLRKGTGCHQRRSAARDLHFRRRSDRRRLESAPARIVFEAWTNAELFKQWWVPKSTRMVLVSCAMDVRTGGTYRLEFAVGNDRSKTTAFFGKYTDQIPPSRIVWTNEEGR